jgi:hypothetical protein
MFRWFCQIRLLLKITEDIVQSETSFDSLISKSDQRFRRSEINVDARHKLFIRKWLINFFLCKWHNNSFHEIERESHAYFWKSINAAFRNENFRFFAMIFEYSYHSKSRKTKDLSVSEFIHHQNDFEIQFEKIKCFKISLIDLSIRFKRVNETHVIKSNLQLIYAY